MQRDFQSTSEIWLWKEEGAHLSFDKRKGASGRNAGQETRQVAGRGTHGPTDSYELVSLGHAQQWRIVRILRCMSKR